RAGASVDLAGLVYAGVLVGDAPGDVRLAGAQPEAVHLAIAGDVDAAAIDGERVLDLLAQPDALDRAGPGVEDADDAALLGDEPHAAAEVGQRGGDAFARPQSRGQVVVGRLDQLAPAVALGEHEQVAGLRRAPDPVPAVEVEVPAAGEVLKRGGARGVGAAGHDVGAEDLEGVRVDDPCGHR